jgi:AcrR family transcriptional regulator
MSRKKRGYHHGDLERALIDATLKLGLAHGAGGVTLREAARVAGVSPMAPYRHFPDKLAMLAATSEEGFRLLYSELMSAPAAGPASWAAAYVDFAVRRPDYFRLMFGQGSPPKSASKGLQAAARDCFQLLFQSLSENRKLAFECWSLAHGMAHLAVEEQTKFLGLAALGDLARDAVTTLLHAAKARG